MPIDTVTIEPADPSYLDAILAILSRVALPHDGVADHLARFLIARRGDALLGCIGLERYGDLGLLRSAAVLPEYQSQRVGSLLVQELLERAAAEGVTEVALLTTTAGQYFKNRFGFTEASRSDYQPRLKESVEWNLPRCSSAVFMTRRI